MEYKTIHITTRAEWRRWLKENYLEVPGVWFTFYKKSTGKKSISYDEAVEEALCYGWIDSIIKKLDDAKYIQKFTPRTNNNKWSDLNIRRMKKLISEKKMTKYGLAKIPPDLLTQKIKPADKVKAVIQIPQTLLNAFKEHPNAFANFNNLAPSYRKIYIGWISAAKKEETQLKRVDEAIKLLAENKKLGLK